MKTTSEILERFDWNVDTHMPLAIPATQTQKDFLKILNSRRSLKQGAPISEEHIGKLLYLSNRVQSQYRNSEGIQIQERPVIASGGLHIIDLLVCLPNAENWWVYDPLNHQLGQINIHLKACSLITELKKDFVLPDHSAIFWMIGDLTRLESKYENAESLLWRDAGAILATQSLVAEYLNLSYCPLGPTGEDAAAEFSSERELCGIGLSVLSGRM